MIKSMTGYGKGEASSAAGKCTVEIRSVNHRYGEVAVRLPRLLQMFEIPVKKVVSGQLKRGKIDVSIQWEESVTSDTLPQINSALAAGYYQELSRLSQELGINEPVSLALVIAQKGVVQERGAVAEESELLPTVMEALQSALTALDGMRSMEGGALAADLDARQHEIEQCVAAINAVVPRMVADYRDKLATRLEQLLGDVQLDPARLAQEVALMADRCDITEEIVRLSSHFKQFQDILQQKEPVGRKLDFLMQEMNREANTIGSKANDSQVAVLVIQIKAELEKMREQVQNIE